MAGSMFSSTMPAWARRRCRSEDLGLAQWQAVVRDQSHGAVPVHPARLPDHEGPDPRGGRIINNGSSRRTRPRPLSSAYTSTKHAITGLTKATNLDGRAYDIAVARSTSAMPQRR